jgi:hypothetical protein
VNNALLYEQVDRFSLTAKMNMLLRLADTYYPVRFKNPDNDDDIEGSVIEKDIQKIISELIVGKDLTVYKLFRDYSHHSSILWHIYGTFDVVCRILMPKLLYLSGGFLTGAYVFGKLANQEVDLTITLFAILCCIILIINTFSFAVFFVDINRNRVIMKDLYRNRLNIDRLKEVLDKYGANTKVTEPILRDIVAILNKSEEDE